MADITLTCDACGATLTLSEYARPDHLACPKCGKALAMPDAKKEPNGLLLPEHIRKAKADAKAALEARGGQPDIQLSDVSTHIHDRGPRRMKTELIVPTLKAAALFLCLAGGLGYLRYFDGYQLLLPKEGLDTVRLAGFYAILFFHIVIVIEALTTDFVTGLLCLIVPGYSLYYLYTSSDSFWLRAIMLALVLVFGRDFAFYVHDYAMATFRFINEWLAAGATPEPTTRLK